MFFYFLKKSKKFTIDQLELVLFFCEMTVDKRGILFYNEEKRRKSP